MRHIAMFLRVLSIGLLILLIAGQPGAVVAGRAYVWTNHGPVGETVNPVAVDPQAAATLHAGSTADGVGPTSRSYDYAHVYLTWDIVMVFNQPDVSITVLLMAADGSPKEQQTGTTSSSGSLMLSFQADIVPGDTVRVTTPDRTYSVYVVLLTATIDTLNDMITGVGPIGEQAMFVSVSTFYCSGLQRIDAPVDASGNYQADFSGLFDIVASDRARVTYWSGGNAVQLDRTAPGSLVKVGGSGVLGNGVAPNEDVTVVLRDQTDQVIASAHTKTSSDTFSYGVRLFDDATGLPSVIEPGDTVYVTVGSLTTVVPIVMLTTAIDVDTDSASGIAPPNAPLALKAAHWTGSSYTTSGLCKLAAADVAGSYEVSLSDLVDLALGDYVETYYVDTNDNRLSRTGYSTAPTRGDISYPAWAPGNTPLTISQEITGDAQHVERVHVMWDTVSHWTNDHYANMSEYQNGGAGTYLTVITPTLESKGVVYFRGNARADGHDLLSLEHQIVLNLDLSPVSVSIGPEGGTLLASGMGVSTTLDFPVGAFAETTVVTLTPRAPSDTGDHVGIWHFFDLTATQDSTPVLTTILPYTVTVYYTDADKGSAIENTLAVYYWNGNQWVEDASSVVNAAENSVTATPDHFSLWAVLGETRRVYLPLVLRGY